MNRVLFVTSSFKAIGGAEKNILDLLKGLDPQTVAAEFAVMQGGPLVDTVRQMGIPAWDLDLKKIVSVAAIRKGFELARRIRERRISIVVSYHFDADLWALVFGKMGGAAVVSSRRDMGSHLSWAQIWVYRLINRWFDRIITVSNAVKDVVAKREWTDPERITTVYNGIGVDPVAVDRLEKMSELGLDPQRRIVGMVASFRPVKGQEFFVRAAAQVRWSCPDTQFVIVGDKNSGYFNHVQRLIKELGLEKDVHCLGERKDVSTILPLFDVFVLSSLFEGFSNALIEAMAAGIPVVAPATGGNPEAITDGVNGFLVPPRDSDRLAKSIIKVLSDSSLHSRMKDAAVARVRDTFSFESMIHRVERLIDSVRPNGAAPIPGRPTEVL